jgi:hypothetical protein
LQPFLTNEENEEYASHTIDRHNKRIKFEPKIGELDYALVKYEKVYRGIIPINNNNNNYLLISLDIEENDFDRIIMEKVIPLAKREEGKFNIDAISNEAGRSDG